MGCCESVLVESPATYPGQRQRPPNNTTNNRATTTTTASAITQQRLQAQTTSSSYPAKLYETKLAPIHQQQNSAEVRARKQAAVQEKIAELTARTIQSNDHRRLYSDGILRNTKDGVPPMIQHTHHQRQQQPPL